MTSNHSNSSLITCTKCNTVLAWGMINSPDLKPCPFCGDLLKIDAFPSLFKPPAPGQLGRILLKDDESGCFYHPDKEAVVPCDHCGRFLCALCDVELNEKHLCPACLESGKKKGRLKRLQNHRVLYDDITLHLAIFPLLFIWPTIITAPLTIFLAIRYWNTPTSIMPRTKIRFVIAVLLSSLQIVSWGAIIYSLST